MKKKLNIPYGIFAGSLFILIFYVTVGFVAAQIVLNSIAAQTNTTVGFFDNWWQTLLFVVDCIFVALFIFCVIKRIVLKSSFKRNNVKAPQTSLVKQEVQKTNTKAKDIELLNKLNDLKEAGLISEKEYKEKKALLTL